MTSFTCHLLPFFRWTLRIFSLFLFDLIIFSKIFTTFHPQIDRVQLLQSKHSCYLNEVVFVLRNGAEPSLYNTWLSTLRALLSTFRTEFARQFSREQPSKREHRAFILVNIKQFSHIKYSEFSWFFHLLLSSRPTNKWNELFKIVNNIEHQQKS